MIVTPSRRLWLYPATDGALEILILGDDAGVAVMYARLRALVEAWRGFDRVGTIGQSGAVLGLRVTLAPLATHHNPIRELMVALHQLDRDVMLAFTWLGTVPDNGGDQRGMVGSW
jgi:hypothetical protein